MFWYCNAPFFRHFEGLWFENRGWLCGKVDKKPQTGSHARVNTGSRLSHSHSQPGVTGGSQGRSRITLREALCISASNRRFKIKPYTLPFRQQKKNKCCQQWMWRKKKGISRLVLLCIWEGGAVPLMVSIELCQLGPFVFFAYGIGNLYFEEVWNIISCIWHIWYYYYHYYYYRNK